MNQLDENSIYCPYCGEAISVLLEPADEDLEYIEDCQVCCRPIVFAIHVAMNGETSLSVRSENDTF